MDYKSVGSNSVFPDWEVVNSNEETKQTYNFLNTLERRPAYPLNQKCQLKTNKINKKKLDANLNSFPSELQRSF